MQGWVLIMRYKPAEQMVDETGGFVGFDDSVEQPVLTTEQVKEALLQGWFRPTCELLVERDGNEEEFFVVTVLKDANGKEDGSEYVVSADRVNFTLHSK